jgi:hypothetical protein
MMRRYRNINHPSIVVTRCPFCCENVGSPCRKKWNSGQAGRPYTETHKARVDEAERIAKKKVANREKLSKEEVACLPLAMRASPADMYGFNP